MDLLINYYYYYDYRPNWTPLSPITITNKEASTVLCFVVKHAGSSRAGEKCRENTPDAVPTS